MKAWKRVLFVTLKSRKLKKSFTFGSNDLYGKDDLSISCSIYKYMSALKDNATIKIDNLTPYQIIQLIKGEFYEIEIWAGYQKGNINKVFSGEVLYISNQQNSNRTNTVVILAASKLVARYGQNRLNLTLNSGINLYSAINFICRRAGMSNSNISTQFKKEFLKEVITLNGTADSWLDKLCSNNSSYIINSDSITEQTFSMFDSAKSNGRVIKIDSSNILLNEIPRLTNDGLEFKILPTFNFICGDTIQIDNSVIDISITNRSQISKNYGAYLSSKGQYMIYEMQYVLQNRGEVFNLQLNCKNRDRISAYVGK